MESTWLHAALTGELPEGWDTAKIAPRRTPKRVGNLVMCCSREVTPQYGHDVRNLKITRTYHCRACGGQLVERDIKLYAVTERGKDYVAVPGIPVMGRQRRRLA